MLAVDESRTRRPRDAAQAAIAETTDRLRHRINPIGAECSPIEQRFDQKARATLGGSHTDGARDSRAGRRIGPRRQAGL